MVLKENQDTWSLPGGGLDHGEDPIAGLERELKEELDIEQVASTELLCAKTFHLESRQAWLMWIVFMVSAPIKKITPGDGVTAAQFIDPAALKDSTDIFEKLVYEVAHEVLQTN